MRGALADVDHIDLDRRVLLLEELTSFWMSGTQVQNVNVVSVSIALSMSD